MARLPESLRDFAARLGERAVCLEWPAESGGDPVKPAVLGGHASSAEELLNRLKSCPKGRMLLIARPATAEEVAECVSAASAAGLSVAALGGGHSAHAGCAEVIVDMALFSDVTADATASTVVVGGGATLSKVTETAAKHGMMVPLGTAPTVGAGLLLQGGMGHLTRFLGLSTDRIVAVDLVLASGQRLQLSQEKEPELLWAVRGHGPNFGVVLSITLAAAPQRPLSLARRIYAPGAGGLSALMAAYLGRAAALPNNVSSDSVIYFDKDSDRALRMGIIDYAVEESEAATTSIPPVPDAELLSETLTKHVPTTKLLDHEDYLKVQPEGTLSPPGEEGYGFYVRCALWSADVSTTLQEQLAKAIEVAPCNHCYVQFQHGGGAASTRPANAGSGLPPSGLEWSAVVTGCWPMPDASNVKDKVIAWVSKTVGELAPASLGTYNVDLGPADELLAGFAVRRGEERARLLRLKQQWDPKGTFGAGAFPLGKLSPPA